MRLLVTGCSNSATGWASVVLTRLGLECTHEKWLGLGFRHPPENAVEASWLAVGWYKRIAPVPTVRLVRDPLAVVRSIMNTDFLAHPHTWYTDFVGACRPEILVPGSQLDRAILYATYWDAPVRSELTVRAEDGAAAVHEMLEFAGHVVDPDTVTTVVDSVGGKVNTKRTSIPIELTWSDILEMPGGDMLAQRAHALGYEVV